MKNKKSTSRSAALQQFNERLSAYSAASSTAVAVGTVLGAAVVHGQTITNITAANFEGSQFTWKINPSIAPSATNASAQKNTAQSHVHIGHNTYGFNPNVFQGNGLNNIDGSVAVAGLGKMARSAVTTRNAAFLTHNDHLNSLNPTKANFGGDGGRSYRLFFTSNQTAHTGRLGGQSQRGNFKATALHPATGYLGFKMGTTGNHGNYYFGWLKVQVGADSNGRPDALTILPGAGGVMGAYALSNDPGIANFKAGDVSAIPEPASVATGLALFALGAVGVHEHRRRRAAAQLRQG